jgi:hypothetical protein
MNIEKSFLEWFDEPEGFSLRSDRLYNDVVDIINSVSFSAGDDMKIMTAWLQAAYRQGARDMAQDTLDTLGDYACALAGLEPEVIKPEEIYDRAQANLKIYYTKVLDDNRSNETKM